jgi:hypothetical protein
VVLQEQSTLGALVIDGRNFIRPPEEIFFPYARLFAREAVAAGGRPVFFMTWSREKDLPAQASLTSAYAAVAREQDAMLAPAGIAWERVRRERPDVKLYADDGAHPSPAGTYLSACVIFTTLTARSCTGAPATISGSPWKGAVFDRSRTETLVALPDDVARYLQEVGSDVARSGAPLPSAMSDIPATRALPRLPAGEPLSPDRVAGIWRGTLAFFLEEHGLSPAPIELTFTPVAGGALAGRIRVAFAQADPLDATIEPRLDREELSFSVANFGLNATIELRAVLRDAELYGVANAVEGPRARWHGSWRARRAVEATSRPP